MPYEGHSTLEVACGGDLEVVHPGYGSTGYGKVVGRHQEQKQAYSSENSSPTDVASPAPVYVARRTMGSLSHGSLYKEGYTAQEQTLLNAGNGNIEAVYGVRGGGGTGPGLPPQDRRTMGLKRNVFIAAAVAVAVFLLGTIITAVTVVMTKKNASGDAGRGEGDVMSWSRVAAINFTDAQNVGRRGVFYQESSGALMMRVQDSMSNVWTSNNITASVMRTANLGGLDVKRGTPIAVASNNFQISLYYLSTANTVSELYMPPNAPGRWFVGALGPALTAQAAANSNLAAYWHICPSCVGASLLVLWQDPGGLLQYANLTDGLPWMLSPTPPSATPSVLGTGLTISPFVEETGSTDFSALRIYRQVNDQLIETSWGPLEKFGWTTGNAGSPITSGLPTDPAPDIHSLTFSDVNMWNNNLVATISRNGSLASFVRTNGTEWQAKPPGLLGGPKGSTAFTSITLTQGLRLYGVTRDGSIHDYRMNPHVDPFTWNWAGTVVTGGGG